MAPLVKIHPLKNGFIQMEYLDDTTGLRFYLHNNKLVDKPILLFPQGMVALVRALPQAYEIYDQQVIQMAETAGQAVSKVIYSIIIASSKVVQVKLEVSDYQEKLYIFLKKSSWAEDEGIWRPCRGSILLDRHHDDCDALLKFALSAH
jgi:hypothetical protein